MIAVQRVISVCPRFDHGHDVYLGNYIDMGVCVFTTEAKTEAIEVARRLAWSTKSQILVKETP